MTVFRTVLLLLSVTKLIDGKKCSDLLAGQYKCAKPEIDAKTQTEKGCRKNNTVSVPCLPAPGILCDGKTFSGSEVAFYREVPCKHVGNTSFEVTLLLSIFLGIFGIDRFYLGYPAIGLFKFCTLGFFMIFQLVDVILIATQVLKPADGSDYVVDYYGARIFHLISDNATLYYSQNFA